MKDPLISQSKGLETYDAIFWYYHYHKVYTKEIMQKTISALETAVKKYPDYALGWAMLGELYLDDNAVKFAETGNPIEEGLKCALCAISIDPNCQHAYQTKAWAYIFLQNKEECVKAVDQCIAINPNTSDMIGGMGFILTCAGEFERGFELLNESLHHNPYGPWWFNAGYVFYFLFKKEYQMALHWAEKVNMPELLWDPLMKASTLGHLNRTEEAGNNLKLLIQLIPDAGNQVKDIIGSFLLSQDLNKEILEGLRKAGLNPENQTSDLALKR